tara:strand:- start:1021 stop:1200 length:180 start_codon:yes stop_codon:yes gene_type:complete
MTAEISIKQAVDLLYCGRSNLIKAAKAADVDPDVLKKLLLERVRTTPPEASLQLTLDLR